MKVLIQTKLPLTHSPVMTVYDSDGPKSEGGAGKAIYNYLNPIVAVTADDGTVLYKSGDFKPVNYLAFGAVLLAAYLIIRRLT
jgi:hypothetical protein